MKILSETGKWKDSWYLGLTPNAKLLLVYLYDNCNVAGFIDYQGDLFSTQLGIKKMELVSAMKELSTALCSDTKRKLFIKDFLKNQLKLPLKKGEKESDLIILKLQSSAGLFPDPFPIVRILEEHVIVKRKRAASPRKKFNIPSIEEFTDYYLKVAPYAKPNDANELYSHYKQVGWTVGKNNRPMKSWEAAIDKNKKLETVEKKNRTQTIFSLHKKVKVHG